MKMILCALHKQRLTCQYEGISRSISFIFEMSLLRGIKSDEMTGHVICNHSC